MNVHAVRIADVMHQLREHEVCAPPRRLSDDEIAAWCAENPDKLKAPPPKAVRKMDDIRLGFGGRRKPVKREGRDAGHRRGTR